jgi:hypothetical protein
MGTITRMLPHIMKFSLLLILTFMVIGFSAKAQFAENNSLYLGTGFSLGNYKGADFNFNYASQRSWSAQFGIKSVSREAENRPADFFGGVLGLVTRGFTDPEDKITSYQFLGGKMLLLSESTISTRLNLLTGPTLNRFQKSVIFEKNFTTGGVLTGTYTFEKEKSSGMGWMVKPSFEVTFGKVIGLGLNPYVHFNSVDIGYGFDFQLLIGILQPSKRFQR